MKPKRIAIFAAIGISLAVIILLVVRSQQAREPSYQGRSLSSWLEEFQMYGPEPNSPPAHAINQMGTNTIPCLLNILSYQESPLRKNIRRTTEKYIGRVSFLEMNSMRIVEAAYAINVLGTNAQPAFAALTNLFFVPKHSVCAAIALAGMGSNGVQVLLGAITNQNFSIRHSAVGGLGHARSNIETVVPELIKVLTNQESLMRGQATTALGLLQSQPELAVPALIERISDSDSQVRGGAIIALGEFGHRAKDAIPRLKEAFNDSDAVNADLAKQVVDEISSTNGSLKDVK